MGSDDQGGSHHATPDDHAATSDDHAATSGDVQPTSCRDNCPTNGCADHGTSVSLWWRLWWLWCSDHGTSSKLWWLCWCSRCWVCWYPVDDHLRCIWRRCYIWCRCRVRCDLLRCDDLRCLWRR